jgi:CRP-like cAMP-binding protein
MDFADKSFERKKFPAGTTIFQSGERAKAAFVVLQGDVDIVGTNAKGERVTYTTVKRGEMFGELALLQADAKRTASAVTRQGCELMTISREKVADKIDAADPFIRYWIRYLSERVIDLSKRLEK